MDINEYYGIPLESWAAAIALRISDEWEGNGFDNKEDVELLRNCLERALLNSPQICIELIGTTIIEETYFDPLN